MVIINETTEALVRGAGKGQRRLGESYHREFHRENKEKEESQKLTGHRFDTFIWGQLTNWSAWRRSSIRTGPPPLRSWWWPIVQRGNIQQGGRDWDREVYDEVAAIDMDKAVGALPDDLRNAVFQRYINRGTSQQQSEALDISERTLYYRLDEANTLLLGFLNDIAAGLEPRV